VSEMRASQAEFGIFLGKFFLNLRCTSLCTYKIQCNTHILCPSLICDVHPYVRTRYIVIHIFYAPVLIFFTLSRKEMGRQACLLVLQPPAGGGGGGGRIDKIIYVLQSTDQRIRAVAVQWMRSPLSPTSCLACRLGGEGGLRGVAGGGIGASRYMRKSRSLFRELLATCQFLPSPASPPPPRYRAGWLGMLVTPLADMTTKPVQAPPPPALPPPQHLATGPRCGAHPMLPTLFKNFQPECPKIRPLIKKASFESISSKYTKFLKPYQYQKYVKKFQFFMLHVEKAKFSSAQRPSKSQI